jgi:gliding motility-associated-like protein
LFSKTNNISSSQTKLLMRPITFILSLFLCAFSMNKAHADAVFSIAPTSTNAAVGTLVTFTVTVNGFVDLNGFQFPIDYDETKLQFVSGTAAPLSASPSDTAQWLNFTKTTAPTDMWIRANYFFFDISGGPTGRTIPNGTAVLTLRFNKIAAGTTDIRFSSTLQPVIQVIDESDALFIVGQTPHSFTATANPPSNLSFIIEKDTIASAGGNTCVTVRTKSFTNMVDFQFGMTYDTTKLVVPPVVQLGTALGSDLLVVNPPVARNQIRAVFTAPTTTNGTSIPATLADSTVLFSVCLTAKPGATGLVSVTFAEFMTPTIFTNTFSNTNGLITNAVLTNGHVQINGTSGPAPTPLRLTVETDSAQVGQSTCVDVRAFGWTNMVSGNAAIAYDTTRLIFNNFMFGANPLNNPTDFQVIHLANGVKQVRLSYTAPTQTNGNPIPSTVPDSTVIFQMCFTTKASAQSGDFAPISFATFQTPTVTTEEFTNTAGVIASYTLQPGSVKIIGTSGNPCSTAAIAIPTGTITQNNVSCFGGSNGSININPTGGTAPLVVTWTGPGATPPGPGKSIMGLVAGVYTPTVTDANGCSVIGSPITINQPTSAVDMVVNGVVMPTCFNGTNGAINATTTGGTTPYSWNWRNLSSVQVATTEDVANIGIGNYSVTVTDANGCTDWVTSNIVTQPSAINIGSSPAIIGATCPASADGFLSITVSGGTGNKTYNWSPGMSSTNQLQNVQAGSYNVTVSDANGCAVTGGPYTVPGPPAISIGTPTVAPANCNSATGSITITVTGGNGGGNVVWSPGGLQGTTITGLAPGTYTPVVTDSKGCTATFPGITVNSTSGPTATATSTNVTCPNANNGTATLNITGGTGATTVNWTPGNLTGASISNLAPGTYTPTLTYNSSCTLTLAGVTITAPQPITGSATVSQITCSNAGNGAITLSVSGGNGGNQVTWMPGGLQGTTISNLAAGAYTPTVTDMNGCTAVLASSTVIAPAPLDITNAVITPQTVVSPPNGSINITVTGGTGTKTYNWAPVSANTEDLTGVAAGTYTVTVLDANNCSMTGSYTIANNSASGSVVSVAGACGFAGGCVTMTVSGLTLPYVVVVDGNTSTANADPFTVCSVQTGTKTFVVTGANGQSVSLTASIINGIPAIADATVTNVTPDNQGGSIILVPNSNALGVYTYLWNNGSTQDTLLSLDAGTYCVTITNTTATSTCTTEKCYTVNYPPIIQLPPTSVNPACGQQNGSITLSFSGGNGPVYNYVIKDASGATVFAQTGAFTTVTATGLGAGQYFATVSDETPTSYPYPAVTLSTTGVEATAVQVSDYQGFGVSSPDVCNGAVTVTPSVGTAPFTFNWSTGAGVNNPTNNVLCSGAYTVTITDVTGCTTTLTGSLTAPTSVVATASAQSQHNGFNVTCKGSCNGIARVVAIGGVAPYNVKWSTGAAGILTDDTDLHDVFSLCAGAYTVTVTDALGTTKVSTVTITEPAALGLTFTQIPPARFTACDGIVIAQAIGAAGTASYTWTVAGGGSGTGSKVDTLCVGKVVTFLVTDANGCTAIGRDTVPYPADGCLEMSPVITPGNQDDKNDAFLITCVESTVDNRVEIFNRYGQLVFDTQNYNNTSNRWEGLTSRGQALPEGVYYVVLTYKNDLGEGFVKKTYVNLIRS